METLNIDQLKYPYGKFEYGKTYSDADIQSFFKAIEELPASLNKIAAQLTPELLNRSYRPEGWNTQQIIHHLADSHINAFIRLKLTLTQDTPTINPYNQDAWAIMADAKLPIEPSLNIIENIHKRMVTVIKAMSKEDFKKTYYHPEYKKKIELDEFVALYAWHGKQHLGHLNIILKSN